MINQKLIARRLRNKVKDFIAVFPWGKDLYFRYWLYPRESASFRGVFKSRLEVEKAISDKQKNGYDVCNETKSFNEQIEIIDDYYDNSDYPVLFWLQNILFENCRVLEIGGSVGYAFYTYQKYLRYPDDLRWTIYELPGAIELGRKIAEFKKEERIRFISNYRDAEQPDILLTSGTLQYLEENLGEIIQSLPQAPSHIIINRVPFYDGPEFWTIQNLRYSEVPYKVQSRTTFQKTMMDLGYSCKDIWHKERTLYIPFYPESQIESYEGQYYRLSQGGF